MCSGNWTKYYFFCDPQLITLLLCGWIYCLINFRWINCLEFIFLCDCCRVHRSIVVWWRIVVVIMKLWTILMRKCCTHLSKSSWKPRSFGILRFACCHFLSLNFVFADILFDIVDAYTWLQSIKIFLFYFLMLNLVVLISFTSLMTGNDW